MPGDRPTLHLICGKIAAGKSTLAARLAAPAGTVLISEDDWLSALFGDRMASPADYVQCAAKLRVAMGAHVPALLRAGVSVVLDFPANTPDTRGWMRGLLSGTGADHRLHVLLPPDELCLARLRARNAKGLHAFAATEAQFHRFSAHFVPPTREEGFTMVTYDQPA